MMLNISDRLQQRMLNKRKQEWLAEQIAVVRSSYPESCGDLDDEALGDRIKQLRATAAELGVTVDANQQRFMHIALQLNDDAFHVSQEWAAIIFAWDSDENLKLSACEQHLSDPSRNC